MERLGLRQRVLRQPNRLALAQFCEFPPSQEQQPLAHAEQKNGRHQRQKSGRDGRIKVVVKLQHAIVPQCFRRCLDPACVPGRFRRRERLFQGRLLSAQQAGLGQKSDPRVRMKNLLNARCHRHRQQPEQRNQRD